MTKARSPAASRTRRRPRAVRLSPEKRRAQLLECAIRVFAGNGIDHTNHAALAKEAHVSPSAVFVYFPTHDNLTEAVIGEVARFYREEIIKPCLSADEPVQALENMLLAFADSIDSHRDIARIWLDWSASIRIRTWPRFLDFQLGARKLVRKAVKAGQAEGQIHPAIDPTEAAQMIVNLGHVIAQMKFSGSSRSQVRRAVHTLLQAYLVRPR